jgi:hypothetical protein
MPTQKTYDVSSLLKRHIAAWWKLYLGLLAALCVFYEIAGPLGEWLTRWLLGHEAVTNGVASVDAFARAVLVIGTLAIFALIVFAVFSAISLVRAIQRVSLAQKTPVLMKTFERTVQAADLIAKQLFPGADTAIKQVLSCKQVLTLYKHGDCQATETLVVTARQRDIHFMEKFITAEEEADPVDFPDEMNLKVTSGTPNRGVSYLISGNEKRQKNVVVFFLPRILASAPEHRTIKITYFWKGFFKRLVTRGEEPFVITIKSVEAIPAVEFEFWVAPGAGSLTCTNVGQVIDVNDVEREKILPLEADDRGMKGCKYIVRNCPVDHTIRLRLGWTP